MSQCPVCGIPIQVAPGAGQPIRCGACGNTLAPTGAIAAGLPAPVPAPADPSRRPPRRRVERSRLVWYLLGASGLVVVVVAVLTILAVRHMNHPLVPDKAWRSFRNPAGQYTVQIPGTAVERPRSGLFQVWAVEIDAQNAFAVAHAEVAGAPGGPPPQEIFDAGRDNLMRLVQGTRLVYDRATNVQGHPGRECEADSPELGTAVMRTWAVRRPGGWRVYALLAAGTRIRGDSPEVRKFFDSFRMTDTP